MASKHSKSTPEIRTVGFISLGCPKNLVDSEKMLGLLAEDGLVITNNPADADAIVINTCGFLQASKDESLEAIRDAAKFKKTGRCQRIVVAGCLAQRYQTKLLREAPEIDRLVGVFDRNSIVAAVRGQTSDLKEHGHFLGKYHQLKQLEKVVTLEADQGRLRLTPRHYGYLRISEGCNQGCAFCTIPSIRGPMRSKPIDRILTEARELAADGCQELNLIGQDTTSYGEDIGYAPGLSGLLHTLDKELTDIPWIRLMYAYPSCFTDEMIHAIADSPRVLRYIDMPLQHINDGLLKVMRRRVTRKQTETLLEKLRKWIPGIAIRTTFIAGSPGETEDQFQELLQFVKGFQFEMMGVFAYSPEPGTAMGRLEGQIPEEVKKERVEQLMLAQQKIAFKKAKAMEGKEIDVLVDRPADSDGDDWIARNYAQAPEIDSVTLVGARKLKAGTITRVKVTGASGYDLTAKPVNQKSHRLRVLPA
jgi:ribosomal protein S12 methylthiotransferase